VCDNTESATDIRLNPEKNCSKILKEGRNKIENKMALQIVGDKIKVREISRSNSKRNLGNR
jgi:hypothetical protein